MAWQQSLDQKPDTAGPSFQHLVHFSAQALSLGLEAGAQAKLGWDPKQRQKLPLQKENHSQRCPPGSLKGELVGWGEFSESPSTQLEPSQGLPIGTFQK